MHPALSVIAFTTLSGAGYGLWLWLGLMLMARGSLPTGFGLTGLGLGLALVAIGLLSSLAHLGRPERAWRALGQWRSSWLSREGVLALLCFLPALAAMALLWSGQHGATLRIAGALLALLAMATVLCTAMIYASLRTVPAWAHAGVPLAYLGFALHTGGLLAMLVGALHHTVPAFAAMAGVIALAIGLALLKRRAWQHADAPPAAGRAAALGLPAGSRVESFERPHTEASFVTREMAFVLARRHAPRLRRIALALFALVPAIAAGLLLAGLTPLMPALATAVAAALAGTLLERWLFFAEARHVVTLYY